jgi:hypothetical protein
MAHKAKLPSFRLFISLSRLTAVLVVCLNVGRIYTPLPKKKQADLKNGWAFLPMFGCGPLWF